MENIMKKNQRRLIAVVNEYLEQNENTTIEELKEAFPEKHYPTLKSYLYLFRKSRGLVKKGISIKQIVYNYLDKLSKDIIIDMASSELVSALGINSQTATVYLHSYRGKHNLLDAVHKRKRMGKNSLKGIVYRFLDDNLDKRTYRDIVESLPALNIKYRTLHNILYRWYKERGIKPLEGAYMRNWSDEELAELKERHYPSYVIVTHKLGKETEPKKTHPTYSRIKAIKSKIDIHNITPRDACMAISYNPAVELVKKICKKYPNINEEKTIEVIKKIVERLHKRNICRASRIKVGAALWLVNSDISQRYASKIMKEFGGCTEVSMRSISKIVKINKPSAFSLRFISHYK